MRRVHFVGIGGAGMSALARVELERGAAVSGSDLRPNALTESLAADGARVFVGQRAEHVAGVEMVVISSAVKADNPEVLEARRLGIPTLKRAEYLAQVMGSQRPICVAGTHGKTTTSAMLALILERAGLQPTYIIGGTPPQLGRNAHAGAGEHFVIEADEYDGMFLGLTPWVAVITNVELDHVDCYPTLDDLERAFAQFAGQTVADGLLLVCGDNSGAVEVVQQARRRWDGRPAPAVWRYGLETPQDWNAVDIMPTSEGGLRFEARRQGQPAGRFELAIPGRHNVSNALAAIAVSAWLGLDAAGVAGTLRQYQGVARRFEVKGEAAGVTVIDDYGHHPTEIRATLNAARGRYAGRRIWAVFQPHTYSRFQALFEEFAGAFADADQVIVMDIYAARERNAGAVHAAGLAGRIVGPPARYLPRLEDAAACLLSEARAGDVIITLGAGDDDLVGEWVLAGLRRNGHAGA